MLQNHQVLQRGRDNNASVRLATGEEVILPVGGPYTVDGHSDIWVGDLWLLAGQSNMQGGGILAAVESPVPWVHSFQSKEVWAIAEEPLHRIAESPRRIHQRLLEEDPAQIPPTGQPPKGAGLGMAFAKASYAMNGVPIGLIPSAHGGTSLSQWSPLLRDTGDGTLYTAMLARIRAVGGTVAGILWYQGESDANPSDATHYSERMHQLVQSVCTDSGLATLPWYCVQIGRVTGMGRDWTSQGWNTIRETQRRLPTTLKSVEIVSSIDLGLTDFIHINTQELQRLGRRLAKVAHGQPAPSLLHVRSEIGGMQLRVTFQHVQGELCSAGRPTGFSLRTVDDVELPLIYAVTLAGDSALLHLTDIPPAGMNLWYGWGFDPYCNLTDATDAAVPAFGPWHFAPGIPPKNFLP